MTRIRGFAFAVLVLMLFVVACFRARGGEECLPVPDDVVKAAGMPVYAACNVDTMLGMTRQGPVEFYPAQIGRTGCFVVIVEYVVDHEGVAIPATLRIRASNEANMERAVFAMIGSTVFVAARKGGQPVAQWASQRKAAKVVRWARWGNEYVPEFDPFASC